MRSSLFNQFSLLVLLLLFLVGGDLLYLFIYQEINIFFEVVLLLATTSVIGVIVYWVYSNLLKPIQQIRSLTQVLSQKDAFEKAVAQQKYSEEIQEIITELVATSHDLHSATNFITAIGKGEFQTEIEALDTQEGLGRALVEMRNQLKRISDEEKSRNWAINGIARFSDLLRENQNKVLSEVSYTFLRDFVHYLEGNQGAVYIIENENQKDSYISCVAAFAYNRQKFIKKTFEMGEGLVGRCILENDLIYMDDIPENYLKITSGLGQGSPRCVLLSPVRFNEITYGVLEIASFHKLLPYQIEFVKNLSLIFGSTVANAKINANTQKLLDNSRVIATELNEKELLLQQNTKQLALLEQTLSHYEQELEGLKLLLSSNSQTPETPTTSERP